MSLKNCQMFNNTAVHLPNYVEIWYDYALCVLEAWELWKTTSDQMQDGELSPNFKRLNAGNTTSPRCMHCVQRGLATRKLSVRLSVRLSVKRVDCNKTAERSVQIFMPYERPFSLVFWEKEWLVGATPSTGNFG